MNNSTNLTLDEQFDKDCKIIKLKYEYPGYTGEEKWAIITGLTEEELNEKYAEKTASLRPFIVLDLAFGKARTKFINNENGMQTNFIIRRSTAKCPVRNYSKGL